MKTKWPEVAAAAPLAPRKKRMFIGAYGFEDRSLGWTRLQQEQGPILSQALLFRYKHPKGKNRRPELQRALERIGGEAANDIVYDAKLPLDIENLIEPRFEKIVPTLTEIVIDISAMTKLLILVCLCKLKRFEGPLRIVNTEAKDYAPTRKAYEESKDNMAMMAKFPSRGVESIIRTKCLSSIRMQGQPVTLVAFTSFNEQLVRHVLGTMTPHRLLFINGRTSRADFEWREYAMQQIHSQLISEYPSGNQIDPKTGLLTRKASLMGYSETISRLDEIYEQCGIHERIICAATGSKMQTVGLFFAKMRHPDIHVEYPTPNSYFVKGLSKGVEQVYEITIPRFREFLQGVSE